MEEASSSQNRPSNTSKHEHEHEQFFSTFVGHFCPPGSGSGSIDPIESGLNPDPIRIRIRNPDYKKYIESLFRLRIQIFIGLALCTWIRIETNADPQKWFLKSLDF
jgi:hypothetical protein